MTREQQFERRLADWLEDGPLDAPERAVSSAVAFAHAHPRRRGLLGGLWRTVMTSMQPTPFPSPARRTRITAFATVAAVAVVAVAVVGGGALLLSQLPGNARVRGPAATATPVPTATASPAARSDEALVADLAAVVSTPYDAAKVAALYAPDAVMHELTDANVTSRGLDNIGVRIRYFNTQDFKVLVTSAPIRQDDFVAHFVRFGTGGAAVDPGLVVYELKDGKVLNQWVYSTTPAATATPVPTPTAPPSPAARSDEALVADLAAVVSTPYDAAKVAALYAPNAVMRELTGAGVTSTGLEQIGSRIQYFNTQDFKVVVTSAPIRQADYIAHFVKFGGGAAVYPGLAVYQLKDGKVLNEWVYPAP